MIEELFNFTVETRWTVKVVICEIQNKKTKLLNMFTRDTIYGYVHTGIQIGPYIIDWLSTSELRLRRVHASDSVMLFLSPQLDSFIQPSDQKTRESICDVFYNFRRKEYNPFTHNCQNFVDSLLKELNIKKSWARKGMKPIRSFIAYIVDTGVSRDKYQLSFYNVIKNITCHKDLKEYWNEIQEPLKTDIMLDPILAMEVVDLIKGLEKGCFSNVELQDQIDFSEYYQEDGSSKYGEGISYTFNR